MRFDDAAAEHQPQPQAAGLGRDKRFEQTCGQTVGNAGPAIFHGQAQPAALKRLGRDRDAALAARLAHHRILCIGQQVTQYQLDLQAVRIDGQRRRRRRHQQQLDAMFMEQRRELARQAFDQGACLHRLELHRAGTEKVAQAAHHVCGASRFHDHMPHCTLQQGAGLAPLQQVFTRLAIGRQGRQRLVQLMRQGGRHLAGGRQAHRVFQFVSHLAHFIDDDADKKSHQRQHSIEQLQFIKLNIDRMRPFHQGDDA